ncbi:hypothetical protein [Luteitalea pratensis]|nr:hypothetical protein [Luteitalea pratensis]
MNHSPWRLARRFLNLPAPIVNAFFTAPLLRVPAKRISTTVNSAQLETRKMAKATARKTTKRASTKRDLVRKPGASAYAKRTGAGQFNEMDDVGRSQRADGMRTAKKTVKAGFGDQGDQSPEKTPGKRASKKR